MSALAYLGISVTMHGGPQGSPLMWGALVMAGAGVGLSASPLLTQSLVHVPLSNAADASGLLTTTMQLGQDVGVAAFGTLFLPWSCGPPSNSRCRPPRRPSPRRATG